MKLEFSSFRDPSGYIFYSGNKIYRAINFIYDNDYQQFIKSGLKQSLVDKELMIDFKEHKIHKFKKIDKNVARVIEPLTIDFISYPYEWSFSQIKDAALLTLDIQLRSIDFGMMLKDASAYNVQFIKNKPFFIDHLSFEVVKNNNFIWLGYRQFCQHFLGPLLLMAKVDISLYKLLINYIDGIPLNVISKLLPKSTYLNFGILSHIHLHSLSLNVNSDARNNSVKKNRTMSKVAQTGLLLSLRKLILGLNLNKSSTEWGDYYSDTNYEQTSKKDKFQIIDKVFKQNKINSFIDLGGNTGKFSRNLTSKNRCGFCLDIDPLAIEKNYLQSKKNYDNYTPIIYDVSNPQPSIGFLNMERTSIDHRLPKVDCVMGLALIHHLCITCQLSFDQVADLFLKFTNKFILIEFVDSEDSQVQRLLSPRKQQFSWYNLFSFENAFKKRFNLVLKSPIKKSKRFIYLFERM